MPKLADFEESLDHLKERLGFGTSYDVKVREFRVGGRKSALVYIQGLIKGREAQELVRGLEAVERSELAPDPLAKLLNRYLVHYDVQPIDDLEKVFDLVLAGPAVLLVDGLDQAIVVDLRQYPVRAIEEPDLERVTRGAHTGFVETLLFNTDLIRRHVRDPRLRFELLRIGRRSKTDVTLAYIQDIARPDLVAELKRRLQRIAVDALPTGARSVEEFVFQANPLNPLPTVRYTERPDVTAAHLLEGYVALIADTTPMAMILPTTAWQFTQHAEEYFQNPLVGTYLRWVRMLGIGLSLVLGPLWLALVQTQPMLPAWLAFIGPEKPAQVPLALQLLLLEVGLDLIRVALIHTPTALATSLGIVGAVLLGQLAVDVGLLTPETILYVAITAIGYFATPSIEFAYALRIFRYVLYAATIPFGLIGLLGGLALVFLVFAFTRSLGLPYLWPLLPFNGRALLRLLFRYPIPDVRFRPAAIAGRDEEARP